MSTEKRRLGERLLEAGLVRESQLAEALLAQQSTGEQLGRLLVRLGYLGESDLIRMLCEDAGIPFTTLQEHEPAPGAAQLLPEPLARSHEALPLGERDARVVLALANPFDTTAVAAVEQAVQRRIAVVGAPRSTVLEQIDRVYRDGAAGGAAPATASTGGAPVEAARRDAVQRSSPPAGERAAPGDGGAPEAGDSSGGSAAQVVDEVFQRGIRLGATDIHVEPTEEGVQVRYRLDGLLREGPRFPKAAQASLLTRIKVMAGLNIAESRLPQDGRIRLGAGGRDIDLRVSTFPTLHGEDVVLRVLDRGRVALNLERIGLAAADLALFRDALRRPLGLILLTGPTGSGKTTTLYSALGELNNGERCILTLEDPVEYELEGIRQAQVNARAGLTFASGLRSMLRHDPDVILVGEIRDPDTARISLAAAMTGHMVLSTLHTNSAAAAIPRLLDMGVEPYALASSFQLSVAQRLVRALCTRCRAPAQVPEAVRRRFGLAEAELFQAVGCAACGQTGYRGRVAVFELLPVDDAVAQAIFDGRSADEIQKLADRPTLLQAGLARVRAGQTTLQELLRVVSL